VCRSTCEHCAQEGWIARDDGALVNPNSGDGLALQGLAKEPLKDASFTDVVEPCNSAARLAATPQDGGLRLYKALPKDCAVVKMAVADDTFPDARPLPAIVADVDDLPKVFDSVFGDREPPRYKSAASGLEFEFTTPPAGFYDDTAPGLSAE